jgi:hypothetical protein
MSPNEHSEVSVQCLLSTQSGHSVQTGILVLIRLILVVIGLEADRHIVEMFLVIIEAPSFIIEV